MRHVIKRGSVSIPNLRAIRGAVQITEDTPEQILKGTRAMMAQIIAKNGLRRDDLISLFFTVTPDLTTELPPLAAQQVGLNHVPMLCAAEVKTVLMIPRVIRVLAHVHWNNKFRAPRHAYLPGTTPGRPGCELVTG